MPRVYTKHSQAIKDQIAESVQLLREAKTPRQLAKVKKMLKERSDRYISDNLWRRCWDSYLRTGFLVIASGK